jgi:hypothetical protein
MTGDAIPGLREVFATLDCLLDRLVGSEESRGRRGAARLLCGKGDDAEARRDGRHEGALAEK